MKLKLSKLILLIIIGIFSFGTLATIPVHADTNFCENIEIPEDVRQASGCDTGTTVPELPDVIENILYGIIGACGIIAVIFVIVGGIQYITSTGDAGKVKKAKDTILYACIGIIVCALAFAIVNWTIGIIKGNQASEQESSQESSQKSNQKSSQESDTNDSDD